MALSLSLLPPAPPPPSGGTFSLTFDVLTDGDVSAVQSLVAPSSVTVRAIAEGSAHPLRTVYPSRDVTVYDGVVPEVTYDEAYHKVEYRWTITRPAGAASTYQPPGPTYSMPTAWNTRNVLYGPVISFTMDVPGTYTIECVATDRAGNQATASFQRTAVDPNVAYAGPLTVACRPVGDTDASWIPADAQIIESGTDLQRFKAAVLAARSATGLAPAIGRRILLKPGANYDLRAFGTRTNPGAPPEAAFNWQGATSTVGRVYIGVPLGTSPATVRTGESAFLSIAGDVRIASITLYRVHPEGAWDQLTETLKDGATRTSELFGVLNFHSHWTIHQCLCDGYRTYSAVPISGADHWPGRRKFRIHWSECFWTGWGFYGTLFSRSSYSAVSTSGPGVFSMFGGKVFRDPAAPQGNRLATEPNNPHDVCNKYPIFRGWGADWQYFGCVDAGFYNWQQPAFRWGDGYAFWSAAPNLRPDYRRWNFDRMVVEGSFGIGATEAEPEDPSRVPGNIVVDRMLQIHTAHNLGRNAHNTGTTIRNSVVIVPPTSAVSNLDTEVRGIFRINDTENRPGNNWYYVQPVEIYNCTGIVLRTPAQNKNATPVFVQLGGNDNLGPTRIPPGLVTEFNNVFHAVEFGGDVGPFIQSQIPGVVIRSPGQVGSFWHTSINFASPGWLPGAEYELPYSSIRNLTVYQQAVEPLTQAYYTANPTHNRHLWYFGATISNAMPRYWTGPTSDYPIQHLGYTSTGIRFRNNLATAIVGPAWVHVDRRAQRPLPNPAEITSPALALSYVPTTGSPALGTAQAPVTSRDFSGNVKTPPGNRGAF